VALPWELLCADDLVVIAETEVVLIKRLNKWKNNVENRGVRVNMNETKVLISGERQKPLQKAARWPCGVCGRGVGSNSSGTAHCPVLLVGVSQTAAFNRGRHLYSAGRPSRWALAHILVVLVLFACVALDLVSSVPAKRLAAKNVSKMTYKLCWVGCT